MHNFIITLLICSVAMSTLALMYMAATPYLAKRYCEKWRYYAWLIIFIGLIIPFRPQFDFAVFRVEMPSSAPSPIAQIGGEAPNQFFPPIDQSHLPSFENVVISDATFLLR